jgi:hypothetical protein
MRLMLVLFILSLTARADLIVDNLNPTTGSAVTTNSQATFRWQSFRPSVAGVGPTDSVVANSPLPSAVYLTSADFVRAPSGTAAAGSIFLDVYAYDSTANTLGAYIGSSGNSLDVNTQPALAVLSWSFPGLSLNPSLEYALAFSSDGIDGNVFAASNGARVSAANFGAGFVETYTGGEAFGSVGAVAFDARFRVVMDVVPEPSTAGLFLLGLTFALLRSPRLGQGVARR